MTHVIVTDLGYGDAGKGSVTDWLCSPPGAALRGERPAAAVVRYNGGAQAGHNVTDGRHWHVFSQFGSGTLRGAPTFLSRYMMIDPLALAAEHIHLQDTGYPGALDLITADRDALITTPYHAAAGQARELARGTARHGSCGKGIGETARFAIEYPDLALRARDCARPAAWLISRLAQIRDLLPRAAAGCRLAGPDPADLADAYAAFADRVTLVDGREHLARLLRAGPVIFEGAQGVLLDEWRGFHPYTTWSTTTSANAETLLAETGKHGYRLGVIRAYMTRHGPGPLVTEDPALDFPEPHNRTDPWQGGFRAGHPDLLVLDYAVQANGGIDGLAVTHLDRAEHGRLRLCRAYRDVEYDVRMTRLNPGPYQDLAWQENLTRILLAARPEYDPGKVPVHELALAFTGTARAPVVLRSHGPGPDAKQAHTAALAKAGA